MDVDKEEWDYVDAHVLTWIYGMISRDLMHNIISPGNTAQTTWVKIRYIFQDNKATQAIYLEDQFTHADMDNFMEVNSYYLHLKNLAHELANVDSKVSDNRSVLKLIKGLTREFNDISTYLEHLYPLPSFYQARSRLILQETRRNHQASREASVEATSLLLIQIQDDTGVHSVVSGRGSLPSFHRGGCLRTNTCRGRGG